MTIETGIAILSAAGLGLLGWACGVHLGRQRRVSPLLFSLVIVLAWAAAWSLNGRLLWAYVLPWPEVIFWANWMPAVLCFAAGLATAAPGLHRWHRPATVTLLCSLAIGFLLGPLARPWLAPTGVDAQALIGWRRGVCLQTHESSCGAASAATLLAQYDVTVDEAEMIDVCFTSRLGTEPLGLYRGLAIEGSRHGLHPRPTVGNPHRWQDSGQLPNVAIVKISSVGNGRFGRWFGAPDERHAVVVLRRLRGGGWLIGDPAVGLVRWSDREMQTRFTGEAICLHRR